MKKNSRATCVAPPTPSDVAEGSERLLSKAGRCRKFVKQDTSATTIAQSAKPGAVPQKRRSPTRTNAFRALRVMHEYAAGNPQTQIAKKIDINTYTINTILHA